MFGSDFIIGIIVAVGVVVIVGILVHVSVGEINDVKTRLEDVKTQLADMTLAQQKDTEAMVKFLTSCQKSVLFQPLEQFFQALNDGLAKAQKERTYFQQRQGGGQSPSQVQRGWDTPGATTGGRTEPVKLTPVPSPSISRSYDVPPGAPVASVRGEERPDGTVPDPDRGKRPTDQPVT